MSDAAPLEYVRTHREELVTLPLDLLAIDTSNPPGDPREIVAEIEQFPDPLPVDVRLTAGVHTPDVLEKIRECVADCEGITIDDAGRRPRVGPRCQHSCGGRATARRLEPEWT
jgi:hypothetical protein